MAVNGLGTAGRRRGKRGRQADLRVERSVARLQRLRLEQLRLGEGGVRCVHLLQAAPRDETCHMQRTTCSVQYNVQHT